MRRSVWFDNLDLTPALQEFSPEISLWRGVIDQAIADLFDTGDKREERMARLAANMWLSDDNVDFLEVCSMAQLTPVVVRSKIKYLKETKDDATNSEDGGTEQGTAE
jgi:hypothetical protein